MLSDIIKLLVGLRWHRVTEFVGFEVDFNRYRACLELPHTRAVKDLKLTIWEGDEVVYKFRGEALRDLWLWVHEQTKEPELEIQNDIQKQFRDYVLTKISPPTDNLDSAVCKQTAYEMAVDLYHRAGMGPRFSGPGKHLAEFDEIIRIAERYMARAEKKVLKERKDG